MEKIVVYHGTPHTVDKFTMDKIGTGDGAQRYGYGLYFAGDKKVAEFYSNNLSGSLKTGDKVADSILVVNGGDIDKSILDIKNRIKNSEPYQIERSGIADALIALEQMKKAGIEQKGNLYKVELKVNKDELLDWDNKPNKKTVGRILKGINVGNVDLFVYGNSIRYQKDGNSYSFDLYNGSCIYNGISCIFEYDDKKASDFLHAVGIKGIKYKDWTSQDGSDNYVIFDENDIEIIECNGILISSEPVMTLKDAVSKVNKLTEKKQGAEMFEEKYQEALSLLKTVEKKSLREDKDLSKQIDLCSKLYNKAKEDTNSKYYSDRFVEEADKMIAYLKGDNKPVDLQSAVNSLSIKLPPLTLK